MPSPHSDVLSVTRLREADSALDASGEAVRAQLARVVASPGFAHAPRRQQFLQFVVEEALAGRGHGLKEFVVAAEVFGRRDTYDPAVDAAVRVEARRVRERLDAYYAAEGAADPIRIHLPVGTYAPAWTVASPAGAGGTADGDARTPRPTAEPLQTARTGAPATSENRAWSGWFIGLVTAVALATAGSMAWLARPGAVRPGSLAVLPFSALDGREDSAYLASGLFEDLNADLSRVSGLTVIGRRSARTLQARGLESADVGRQLGVAAVLDGTVRREDDRVRITARLIDTESGRQLWAHAYDRPWQGILEIQRDVASAVSDALAGHFGGLASGGRHMTANPEAWDAFLKGRYLRTRRTETGLRDAVPLFQHAVTLDPGYAEAWAALGEALTTEAFHGFAPKNDIVPQAREALDRAITLSPDLAGAHAARAWLALVYDWRWREAEEGFRRALALDPGLAQAHQMFAFGLASRSRFDEALAHSREATALDPHAYAASTDFAVLLLFARRYDAALDQARQSLRLDPALSLGHVVAGSALLGLGQVEQAIGEFGQASDSARFSTVLGRLGYAYAVSGRTQEARAILARLDAVFGDPKASPIERAYIHAGLGDRASALACLRDAVDAHDGEVIFLDVQPFFDTVRTDPAFRALRSRVGLDRR